MSEAQASLINVPCLICGGAAIEIIASTAEIKAQLSLLRAFHRKRRRIEDQGDLADRADFTQEFRARVVECRACGFIFRTPRPPASAVTRAYAIDRYSKAHLDSEFLSERQWGNQKLLQLAPWLTFRKMPVIVEVGSFVGGFLAAGHQHGWSMLGVDPGKQVTEFCFALGLQVFRGTLADAPIDPGSVDALVIWNTFDQLPNPDITLAVVRRVLRDAGLLVIRVPNGECVRRGAGLLKRRGWVRQWVISILAWNNLLAFPYLHGYSISTLDELVGRHGLQRRMIYRDTLMRLADDGTKGWASWEEKLIKACCHWVAAAESLSTPEKITFAPWLDIYYGFGDAVSCIPVSFELQRVIRFNTLADFLPCLLRK